MELESAQVRQSHIIGNSLIYRCEKIDSALKYVIDLSVLDYIIAGGLVGFTMRSRLRQAISKLDELSEASNLFQKQLSLIDIPWSIDMTIDLNFVDSRKSKIMDYFTYAINSEIRTLVNKAIVDLALFQKSIHPIINVLNERLAQIEVLSPIEQRSSNQGE